MIRALVIVYFMRGFFLFDLNQVNSVHSLTCLLIISGEGEELTKPSPFLYENLTFG